MVLGTVWEVVLTFLYPTADLHPGPFVVDPNLLWSPTPSHPDILAPYRLPKPDKLCPQGIKLLSVIAYCGTISIYGIFYQLTTIK